MGKIVLGILGILQPTTSALLHNTSALLIGLHSMKDVSQIIMYEKKNKNYVKCLTWFLFFYTQYATFSFERYSCYETASDDSVLSQVM